jgi:hypothetical protein
MGPRENAKERLVQPTMELGAELVPDQHDLGGPPLEPLAHAPAGLRVMAFPAQELLRRADET